MNRYWQPHPITDGEFSLFQRMLADVAGIKLAASKKALVGGRLARRLRERKVTSYGDYFRLVEPGGADGERQIAIDLLTTNETYFFREPRHFAYLRTLAEQRGPGPFSVWSAACSSGEEAYSIALVLADVCGADGWNVLGTDLSTRMLERARRAQYALHRANDIPRALLDRFCLRGIGAQHGTFIVSGAVRERVALRQVNLNAALPDLGLFDVVFLRNVMIYFDLPTKQAVVERVAAALKPGGILMIGHSESLNGIGTALRPVAPSIYRKEAR